MGVPKFFRYISERYPCLSELINEQQIAEFDNLYLDMNGIIHNCSHPDDGNVQFRISEDKMFQDIFHYIEVLFGIIKPQKLFFLAIDGVAPRAKMNQQRGRRFRSAKDAERQEMEAREKNIDIPTTKRFDSNCITPGTVFMMKLHKALQDFIDNKMSTSKAWQRCRIILSGHDTPGEGEHKIMEYIRYMRIQPDYNPHTRHCLYGLDADLIMLGLCTHEVNISLLREEVKFGRKAVKSESVDSTRFYLLHLGLFREYLELEFAELKTATLPFPYDVECIVDDFILMSFMVGNDFIPHLPNLHIHSNALPILFKAYIECLPTLTGYLNENGKLNLKHFEVFMRHLSNVDRQLFEETYADLKYMNGKRDAETFDTEPEDYGTEFHADTLENDLLQFIKESEKSLGFGDDDDSDDENALIDQEFMAFKRDYYIKKLNYPDMTPEVLAEQANCYITALQWTLYYYYRGVRSWTWFYPHHYAPFISDIQKFSNFNIKLELGEPFLPFEQLLAVLPPGSIDLLPRAYHSLMSSDDSPIIDYYPKEFLTDLNGKKQEWEAVVLIPFIDEERLLTAMRHRNNLLTNDELNQNVHGPMTQFDYVRTDDGDGRCQRTSKWRKDVDIPQDSIIYGKLNDANRSVYYAGFPSMQHIPHTGSLEAIGVRVFDQPSRNVSMVIKILNPQSADQDVRSIANLLLGQEVYVDWPHLREAKVMSISDENIMIDSSGETKVNSRTFQLQTQTLNIHYKNRMALDVGDLKILVTVSHCTNYNYKLGAMNSMHLYKEWSTHLVTYPLQVLVQGIAVHKTKMSEIVRAEEIFHTGSIVYMISTIYYGCQGKVLDPSMLRTNGRIQIQLIVKQEPDIKSIMNEYYQNRQSYKNLYASASGLGISTNVFARITGTVFVIHGQRRPLAQDPPRTNVGLQLKFPKKNEELSGYTKKIGNGFQFSDKAIKIVNEYYEKYPKIFEMLSSNVDEIFEADLFPPEAMDDGDDDDDAADNKKPKSKLHEMSLWLKGLPHMKVERRTCGSESVDEEFITMLAKSVDVLIGRPHKSSKIQVKPYLLYKPNLSKLQTDPDPNAVFRLFDRVVCVNDFHAVPLGWKGTIIGVQQIYDPNPVRQSCLNQNNVLYDVLFDEAFAEGVQVPGINEKRVYKVSKVNLINITYGITKFAIKKPNEQQAQQTPSKKEVKVAAAENVATEKFNRNEELWNILKRKDETSKTFSEMIAPLSRSGNEQMPNKPKASHSKIGNISAEIEANSHKTNTTTTTSPVASRKAPKYLNKPSSSTNDSSNEAAIKKLINTISNQSSQQQQQQQSLQFHQSGIPKVQTNSTVTNQSIFDAASELRRVLKIQDDNDNNKETATSNIDTNFKKVDVYDLPKPPSNWRDSKPTTTNNKNKNIQNTNESGLISMSNHMPFNNSSVISGSGSGGGGGVGVGGGNPLPPPFIPPQHQKRHHQQQQQQQHQQQSNFGTVPLKSNNSTLNQLFYRYSGPPSHPIVHPQPHPISMRFNQGYSLYMDYSRMPSPQQGGAYNPFFNQQQHQQQQQQQQQQQHQQQQQQQQHQQQKHQQYPQRPNGPQNLSDHSSYSPGHGAFIPLQATKQQFKQKTSSSTVVAQKNLNGTFNALQNTPITQLADVEFNTKSTMNSNSNCNNQIQNDTKSKRKYVPPPAQPSRLAARFDQQTNN